MRVETIAPHSKSVKSDNDGDTIGSDKHWLDTNLRNIDPYLSVKYTRKRGLGQCYDFILSHNSIEFEVPIRLCVAKKPGSRFSVIRGSYQFALRELGVCNQESRSMPTQQDTITSIVMEEHGGDEEWPVTSTEEVETLIVRRSAIERKGERKGRCYLLFSVIIMTYVVVCIVRIIILPL